MKYQAIVFDLFGTLVDNFSLREHEAVLRQMAAVLSAPSEGFARLWVETFNKRAREAFRSTRDNIEYVCRRLGVRPNDECIKLAVKIRVDFTRCSLRPRDDALETLTQLRWEGYKIGLISNCSTEVPLLWADTSFAPLIDTAISGVRPREFFKYYGKVSMVVDDEVDIVDLDDVREHFLKRILSKGRVIYERGV